ncbi:hypothetical protein [Paenibacillus sp. y28]|uniref:hypothetical protein n=1 Tax=Paenibacillus sp. y28 TaxID=3129110 RepID=UPI0030176EF1
MQHKLYRHTMIILLLTSLFQIYMSVYSLCFTAPLPVMKKVSETGMLALNVAIFTVTLLEWSYSESRWFHRAYRFTTYLAIVGFGLLAGIFIKQGIFTVDSISLLLSITTVLILLQKYYLLYKN